ncbi:MAG: pantoate--beta-alanine ligase [Cytophagales bacterium]|nr:pantoate--beta-alanine ligase [Cytophagales bacterium]
MEIIHDVKTLRWYIKQIKLKERTIGFVPTMGALHDGHLRLVQKSILQNDITVSSIFVNPSQFNNRNDFKNYPRETESDISKLEMINCGAVFVPSSDDMYGEQDALNFDFGYLEEIMEGKFRPGHFKGVGLIVAKLFNLVKPDRAYFGKKDLQQIAVIRKLTAELLFDVEIVPVNTVREKDGLAMSSRNKLLSKEDRVHAGALYMALNKAREKLIGGENVNSVKKYVTSLFNADSKIKLEYFEVVQTSNLRNILNIDKNMDVSLCIAGYLGNVRLIDNISLN